MTQAIKELAEKRRKWVEANRENGFEAGLKRLLTDLYPGNAHFIYELLQNAEDAHAQEVRFILNEDCIEFEHDGERLFSIQDVDAITSIGFSTKRDDVTKIGKFGVGFKAVFAYTDSPEIESGGFHFRIGDMVVPESSDHAKKQLVHKQTRFVLPFNNPKKPSERAYKEIETLLKDLGATTLLFLIHIRKIEYLLPDSSLGYIERIARGDCRFEICVQQPGELAPMSTCFLKFDKEVQVEDEETENEDRRLKSCRISVAFGLSRAEPKSGGKKKGSDDAEAAPEWELAPMDPGRVCIYFPADKETSNLRFHIHAPFASTVARDSVRDCAGNDALRDHLAELLAESMPAIRDQGLLTVRALALLPNDKDNLPEFYKPVMKRLAQEFQEQDLVPMKSGGHAAASGIFRGQRALSELIDDDDMVMLLGDDYATPIWASNPPQRNQREDNFLSMLDIEQWDTAKLVKALDEMNEIARAKWMDSKDDKWHQTIYEMLMDHLNTAPKYPHNEVENRKRAVAKINLIRCNDGAYRKGKNCFFPTEEVEQDDKFPRVAKGVYVSGNEQNKKAREFLAEVGVREVDEKVEIESLLKEQYSQEAVDKKTFRPNINHIKRFVAFIQKYPDCAEIFRKCYILKLESGKWGMPRSAYLDKPYMDTGLRAWYEAFEDMERKNAISSEYEKCGIKPEKIGEFAETLGVPANLLIEKTEVTYKHPEWNYLSQHGGERWSGLGTNEDYFIPRLKDFLASPSISKSRLVWHTMTKSCCDQWCQYLKARFGRNASNITRAKSTLVHDLTAAKWVPQKAKGEKFEFVSPRDAAAEKLPVGFEYQTGWQWLHDLEFGKGVEERKEATRRELERQTAEYKRKEEVARDMGFESPEEAEEIARLKKENPEEFREWKEKISARKKSPTFPTRPVANPERRQERLGEQLSDAPEKEYEKRERSVRTTNGTIDPITWLRNQYRNEAGQMVCQICKEEHFRKRNGEHYFEKKEILSRKYLPKEHVAQYLALCPLCAAKYEEFIKSDEDALAKLKEAIFSADECEIPISFGDQQTSIRFVETHYHDLRIICEESFSGEDD